MFNGFFYALRQGGLDVSMSEWLALLRALEQNLHGAWFSRFYYLCRSVLVKSEKDFDKFDGVFLQYFKDVEYKRLEIPEELWQWLEHPDHEKGDIDRFLAEQNRFLSGDQIREMFLRRLQEQKEEHDGGSYWIGTHGASVFGNDGYSPKGIRVGGQSRYRNAIEVAGERKFADFREDKTLDMRRFQVALRSLRQFSSQLEAPKTQLNIDESIRKTGNNGGRLELVFQKPRRNTVKLLLLMDSGGSMDEHRELCADLFQAVKASSHLQELRIYYFHNVVKDHLYTSPGIHYDERIETEWVLRNLSGDYKVLLIGDAMMDPEELYATGRFGGEAPVRSGLEWLELLRRKFPRLAWVNPQDMDFWQDKYWGQTIGVLREQVPMYQLTVEGLREAFRGLLVRR